MELLDMKMIGYADVKIDKDSLPFERKEKMYYDIIRQYEQDFKAIEQRDSYDMTQPYWIEWHKCRDRISHLSRKDLMGLMGMWCHVRPAYDVVDICKCCF